MRLRNSAGGGPFLARCRPVRSEAGRLLLGEGTRAAAERTAKPAPPRLPRGSRRIDGREHAGGGGGGPDQRAAVAAGAAPDPRRAPALAPATAPALPMAGAAGGRGGVRRGRRRVVVLFGRGERQEGEGGGDAAGAGGFAHGLRAEAGPGSARGRRAAREGGRPGVRAHPHRARRDALHADLVATRLLLLLLHGQAKVREAGSIRTRGNKIKFVPFFSPPKKDVLLLLLY